MNERKGSETDTRALRARNVALASQLKRLVKTEQRLSLSQRELGRQLRRVDALNQFAMRAVMAADTPTILKLAMDMFFSLFPFEQGLALTSEGDGSLRAAAVRSVPGREGDSEDGFDGLTARGGLAIGVPYEPTSGTLSEVRDLGEDSGRLLDLIEDVYGAASATTATTATAGGGPEFATIVPLHGPHGRHRSVIVLRRPAVRVNFHDQLPGETDEPFLRLAGQAVGAALTNAHLVTDLKLSLEELERAQRDLLARERLAAIGELAAVVAHEVRNPLGAIFNSLANIVRIAPPNDEVDPLLGIIREEASRVNRTVADLLEFARPAVLDRHDQRLSDIAEDAVESACADAGSRGVSVRLLADQEARAIVDEHLLRRALLNLIDNAIQASEVGDVVEVRVSCTASHALIEVEDVGHGISDETLDQVFEPFFTTRSIGTGLGLAVVKRFADTHGGEVLIHSSPRTGSVFTIRLDAS